MDIDNSPSRPTALSPQVSAAWWACLGAVSVLFAFAAFGVRVLSGQVSRDSGVFIYTGMVVSEGGMPYVDSWDHKGPLTYVLNAWSWGLGHGFVGVAAVEGVVFAAGLIISALLWMRLVSPKVVLAGTIVVGVTFLNVYEGGNFTESWLFPVQLATYSYVATALLKHRRDLSRALAAKVGVVLGFALAVAVLTRVNNGLGVLALLVIVIAIVRRYRWVLVLASAATIAVISVPIFVWLWHGDALRAAFEQYIGYSFAYSGTDTLWQRVPVFGELTRILIFTPVGVAALVLLPLGLVRGATPLAVRVFVLVFAVDSAAQLISGRGYTHYVLGAAAALSVLAMIAAHGQLAYRRENPGAGSRQIGAGARLALTSVVGIALVGGGALAANQVVVSASEGVFVEGSYQQDIVQHIVRNTTAEDTVLVHGAETWILAAAERRSPTMLTYYMPALQGFGGYAAQYLEQIMSAPPKYIVETPVVEPEAVCGISRECATGGENLAGLAEFVKGNYVVEGSIAGFIFWKLAASD